MRINVILAAIVATTTGLLLTIHPTQVWAAEPSLVELKAALHDMDQCSLASTYLANVRGDWPTNIPPKGQFEDAKIALLQHGANRPDFTRAQRKELSAVLGRDPSAWEKLSTIQLQDKVLACLPRLDQLRPMLVSYRMSETRKNQCIKAFEEGQFAQLKRYQGAKQFELFSIYPDAMPRADVISRPTKVRMMFIVLQPWTQTTVSISGDRAFDVKSVTLDDYHWVYVGLQGDCPAKDD